MIIIIINNNDNNNNDNNNNNHHHHHQLSKYMNRWNFLPIINHPSSIASPITMNPSSINHSSTIHPPFIHHSSFIHHFFFIINSPSFTHDSHGAMVLPGVAGLPALQFAEDRPRHLRNHVLGAGAQAPRRRGSPKMLGKSGKIMENPMENHGNSWKIMKHGGFIGENHGKSHENRWLIVENPMNNG